MGSDTHRTRFLTAAETNQLKAEGFERIAREGLTHVTDLAPCDWLVKSIVTFAKDVTSFVPGDFDAFARVYHPIVGRRYEQARDGSVISGDEESILWRDIQHDGDDAHANPMWFDPLKEFVADHLRPQGGSFPARLMDVMLEILTPATTTPDECYFAVWNGFGGSVVPPDLRPQLKLPSREYHVFRGPISAVRVDFDEYFPGQTSNHSDSRQSANLWWPVDHAWCVMSEIDLHGTYVGASRGCIDALLADRRLETSEVFRGSR